MFTLLPNLKLPFPDTTSILGPSIDYSENLLKQPAQGKSGILRGVDTIAFGEGHTSGDRSIQPLGVRFWMNTGYTCSNGKPMFEYVDGVPKGEILGKSVKERMRRTGMPLLRGLAPGALEDLQVALDPSPVLNAAFGKNLYPKCRLMEAPVGDQKGDISMLSEEDKKEVKKNKQGVNVQTKWAFEKWLTEEEYRKELPMKKEGFENVSTVLPALGLSISILLILLKVV